MRGLRLPEARRSRGHRRNQTDAERKLWSRLRNRRLDQAKFVRQEPIGPYFADFVCRDTRLVIEVDGATHSTDEERAYDARRTAFLKERGFRVLRFTNVDVFENIEGVLMTIFHALNGPEAPLSTDWSLTLALSPPAGRGNSADASRSTDRPLTPTLSPQGGERGKRRP